MSFAGGAGVAVTAPTFTTILIASGKMPAPEASVVRRVMTRYGHLVQGAFLNAAGRDFQAALDIYAMAKSLPSLTTANELLVDGFYLDGPLYEGSPVTRCFDEDLREWVLKPLDEREYSRASALLEALAGSPPAEIPELTPFKLHRSSKANVFMLMPLFGASLEVIPHLAAKNAEVLWRCMRDALRRLHALGFAHMDVKPANICLSAGAFVLIDLGSVARFNESASTTPAYVPSDYPRNMKQSSALADWWLLAMTLAEKATGLDVGSAVSPTMRALDERLEEKLPPSVWAELRAELYRDER